MERCKHNAIMIALPPGKPPHPCVAYSLKLASDTPANTALHLTSVNVENIDEDNRMYGVKRVVLLLVQTVCTTLRVVAAMG